MTHIKRINEMLKSQKLKSGYRITNVFLTITEDNYTNGETEEYNYTEWEPNVVGDSILDVAIRFLEDYMYGHEVNKDNFYFMERNSGVYSLTYNAMGRLNKKDFEFDEPTEKELEDFKNNKINLSAYDFDMTIEKFSSISKQDFIAENIPEY